MRNGSDEPEPQTRRPSRRHILGALGAGAGAAIAGLPTPAGAQEAPADDGGGVDGDGPGRFSRMFASLPVFAEPSDELAAALVEIGRPGGIMDAGSPGTDNFFLSAGHTFFGQFIDHDLTFDAESTLGVPAAIERSVNMRSARFDLDNVYGGGPALSPQLYREDDPALFRVESGGRFEDLPRGGDGAAIIADSRDDENLVISGLHCAFLVFHNAVVADLRSSGAVAPTDGFDEARQVVIWHYQWIVLHEVLPLFVGRSMVDQVLADGRQWFTPTVPTIPVEFQVAAYRFGHSLVQGSYTINDDFTAPIFDTSQHGVDDPNDLRGGQRGERRWVDWSKFFDFGVPMRHNRRIGTTIASALLDLPTQAIDSSRAEVEGPTSLASRNLLRHVTWGIPSGQAIAELIGAAPVGRSNFGDLEEFGLATDTPLWFYLLREADRHANGVHLGPVGGRIVAEVFIGLLELDPTSFLSSSPQWTPTLPTPPTSPDPRSWGIRDMLRFAGVDPQARAAVAEPEITVALSCAADTGRVDVDIVNRGAATSLYSVTVGRVGPRTRTVAAGDSARVTVTGRRDGPLDVVVTRDGVETHRSTQTIACKPIVEATLAVSCAAGSGRFDIELTNPTDSAHDYTVVVQGLAPRTRRLEPQARTTIIVTGRPDRTYLITATRGSTEILRETAEVRCKPVPADEVQLSTSCLAGNGRVDIDLWNPTLDDATYEVLIGSLAPRTRTLAPNTTAVVTATGRADGELPIVVRRNGEQVLATSVTIACDVASA